MCWRRMVLKQWKSFSIWGAGRDGRKFYMHLAPENQTKVTAALRTDAMFVYSSSFSFYPHQQPPPRAFLPFLFV